MSDEQAARYNRASVPRPSICRMVVVSRKDGEMFPVGHIDQTPILVRAIPATVVGVEVEITLTTLVMVGDKWFRVPHRDLAGEEWPGDMFVWTWPERA